MIRVVYQWRVQAENFQRFEEVWSDTTNHIHKTVPGALGSFMLRNHDDPCEVLTVAKWVSKDAWQAFWMAENPKEMLEMRRLGERLSVTAYDEIGDHTR